MGIIYLLALVVGAGTIGVQLLLSGKGDHADGGHDMDHVDIDAEADMDAGHGHPHGGDALHADGSILPIILSFRFWTFAFLTFGMVGSALHFLKLAGSLFTPAVALGSGIAAGLFASWTFRALARSEVNSGAQSTDAVGQVGRVLIPVSKERPGKIRIQVRGQAVDLLATTDDESLPLDSEVLIEEMHENTAHVSLAPEEFRRRLP